MDPTSLFGSLSRPNIKQGLSFHHPAVTAIQKMLQGRRGEGRGRALLTGGSDVLSKVTKGMGVWVTLDRLLVTVVTGGESVGGCASVQDEEEEQGNQEGERRERWRRKPHGKYKMKVLAILNTET